MKEEDMESRLIEMQPAPLHGDLLDRLDRAMIQAYKEGESSKDLSLEDLELTLKHLAPSGLGEGFLSRMDSAMQDWQEEGEREAKIVPFSAEEKEAQPEKQGRLFWRFASVAAVALFGGVVALVMTGEDTAVLPSVAQYPASNTSDPLISSTNLQQHSSLLQRSGSSPTHPIQLTKSTANRNIIGVSSEGVRKNHADEPCRCIRVEYIDIIELLNSEGKRIKIEEPKVEYLYIPIGGN